MQISKMKRGNYMKNVKQIALATVLLTGTAITAWAAVPAPPVNQHLGLGDTTFNNMVENDCRICHNQTPPAPYPVDPTYLPDRHHLLVDTPIPSPSDVPNPDADSDGIPDVNYDCLNCHSMTFDSGTGTWELDPNFRDCTLCHVQTGTSGPTVHHRANEAQGGDCAYCHGSFVDSGLLDDDGDGIQNAIDPDGGWIPAYQVSLVTPFPGGLTPISGNRKPNGDPNTVNSWGQEAGNCSFCHSELTGVEGSSVVEDTGPFAPVEVFVNSTTHHTTGLQTSDKCVWCHDFDVINPDDPRAVTPIRTCENCHGIPSLHNIQFAGQDFGFPNNDGTVLPGAEPAGFGHIGSQDDCWGCHGYENGLSAPSSGPVIPGLYDLSASSVQAGSTVVLTGTAFVNKVQNPMTGEYDVTLASDVVLTDANGTETVVVPVSVTGDTIEADIPSTMATGNYQIAAKKALKRSNPMNVAITPAKVISSTTCVDGSTTISGSGFSSYLDATDSGTSVTGDVTTTGGGTDCSAYSDRRSCRQQADCSWNNRADVCEGDGGGGDPVTSNETAQINSWTDTQIEAQFSACPDDGTVVVNTVWDITGSVDPPDPEAICDDGIDNDGDGDVDCEDSDCSSDDACQTVSCSDYTDKGSCRDAGCDWNKKNETCN